LVTTDQHSLRGTTRPFAQLNLILAHLQHSKFHIVYIAKAFGNVSPVVCLHSCEIECVLKQTFAQRKIFLQGTLLATNFTNLCKHIDK